MDNKNTFDLKELYRKAFGGPVAIPFPIGGFPNYQNTLPVKPENIDGSLLGISKKNAHKVVRGEINQKTMLGTPIHIPVKIGVPGLGKKKIVLPNEPIVSITGGNDIVVTSMPRGFHANGVPRRGTIKEIVNMNDYKINIKGIIINLEEDDYPEETVRGIRAVLEVPSVIEIQCKVLEVFDIHLATVESFRFPRDFNTKLRWCWYEINLVSDDDFEYSSN